MLSVNFPIHLITAAIRHLNKGQTAIERGIAQNMLRTLEVNTKPGVIKLTPEAQAAMENIIKQRTAMPVAGRFKRGMTIPNMFGYMTSNDIPRWSTPERKMLPKANGVPYEHFKAVGWTDDQLVDYGYMAAGNPVFVDPASPSGDMTAFCIVKPDIKSLHRIAAELNNFKPAWENKSYDELVEYIVMMVIRDREIATTRNAELSERFNLLEDLQKQLGTLKWSQMLDAIKALQERCGKLEADNTGLYELIRSHYPDTRRVLKALPEETLVEAAERQMDRNAKSDELFSKVREDLNIMPGVDINQHLRNLRDSYARQVAYSDGLKQEINMVHDTSEYRRKCLDQIADMLNLEQGVRTPAYVVEVVGVRLIEAVKAQTQASEADNNDELELLRTFRNRVIKVFQNAEIYSTHNAFMQDMRDAVQHGVK